MTRGRFTGRTAAIPDSPLRRGCQGRLRILHSKNSQGKSECGRSGAADRRMPPSRCWISGRKLLRLPRMRSRPLMTPRPSPGRQRAAPAKPWPLQRTPRMNPSMPPGTHSLPCPPLRICSRVFPIWNYCSPERWMGPSWKTAICT